MFKKISILLPLLGVFCLFQTACQQQAFTFGPALVENGKRAHEEYKRADGGARKPAQRMVIAQDGPPHARVFTARVMRGDGTELGCGQGARKQRAEEAAARQALAVLGQM